MNLKINSFKGYKYRRYASALLLLAAVWFPYGVSTYFIYPSWVAFAAAVVITTGGCIPLIVFALHLFAVADNEFQALEGSNNGK